MVKVLIREEWDPENWKRGMWEDLEDEDIEFLNSDESSLPIEGASPPQDKKPQHPHLRGLTLYCH